MPAVAPTTATHIARYLHRGDLVAVADGVGMASDDTLAALSEVASALGDVHLLLGWCLGSRSGLDLGAFSSVRTVMGGYAWRAGIQSGRISYVPSRLGTIPALMRGRLRPDVLLVALASTEGHLGFGTEVGWARSAADVARVVIVEERSSYPMAAAVEAPTSDQFRVVATSEASPDVLEVAAPDEAAQSIGRRVAAMVPAGAAVQVGPGVLGKAVLDSLAVPVRIDSGVLVDAVIDLERRGFLIGDPLAAYIAGGVELYDWSANRPMLRGVEETHDISRLARSQLFAINTALEIDEVGQINVEAVGGDPIAGIGGHADFALAASRSTGLSIVAIPTHRLGRSTLVPNLTAPVSTARTDVDMVVTERGAADLRGLSDRGRRELLCDLWGSAG